MDELSEQINSLNVSADDLDVSADEDFPFLSESDSYDLNYDISLKNYDGLVVHEVRVCHSKENPQKSPNI